MPENLLDPEQLKAAQELRSNGLISATYWLPRITEAGLPVPRTEIVPYDHVDAIGAFEGGEGAASLNRAITEVAIAGHRIGFPVFIRTDVASAKHEGPSAYRLDDGDVKNVQEVLYGTIGDTEMKVWLTGPYPQAILVREWLDIRASFTAFGGHPIGVEWRVFANAEGPVCRHFYWPEEAIKEPDTEAWRFELDGAEGFADETDLRMLDALAWQAAGACGGQEWSVDFALDRKRHWWLIDMAPADVSWHPEHEEAAS